MVAVDDPHYIYVSKNNKALLCVKDNKMSRHGPICRSSDDVPRVSWCYLEGNVMGVRITCIQVEENRGVACSNCEWCGAGNSLRPVEDIVQRVYRGERLPAGECPECYS